MVSELEWINSPQYVAAVIDLAKLPKEEFRIILAFPDEEQGRAYIRTEFHEIGGRRFPREIIREDLGSESAPTWPRVMAENTAAALRALFPQTTIELKRVTV